MLIRRIIHYIGTTVLFVLAIAAFAHDTPAALAQEGTDKIEGSLQDQLSTQGYADFIAHFGEQADLSPAYSMDWERRGEFVYNTLRTVAEHSQAKAKALLEKRGLKYQTFIAGNELYIWAGNQTSANELASLPEVVHIRATQTYSIDPIRPATPFENISWAGDLLANNLESTVNSSTTALMDWGINNTRADQFWNTFGHQGDGIVVANIDTGVKWDHPALDQAFKCGTNPTDPACWFEPVQNPSLIQCPGGACDNQGHGTHTMGTMVGDNDPGLLYNVGMAPDAKWIACKGCESNLCSDYALNSCADWILAPGGSSTNRPNVVNNSWGSDTGGNDPWYQAKVTAWRAAGIFPAFSAGNAGPGCETLGSPGDYQESFGSAAHDSGRNIASFSSRGPALSNPYTPYTKPNISAPGVNIWSSYYVVPYWVPMSGTSMASPHTAGAVALLWSCNPALKGQINATFQLLQNHTDTPPGGDCGAPPNGQGNYTYGYGYLDVLAAGIAGCGIQIDTWNQNTLPAGCPDWTRFDGEYYPRTGKVYFMGGRDSANSASTFGDIYAFDPAANSCADTMTDMPTPISNYTIARVNDGTNELLCTFGGRNAGGGIISTVQCYNPVTNSVIPKGNLPGDLGLYMASGVAVVNNKTYVFGGFRDTAAPYHSVQTWEWNPVANSWLQKGNLALGRGYMDTAVVDHKIYAFGGDIYSGGPLVAQTKAEVFDPVPGNWNDPAVADLPVASGEGTAYGFDSYSPYELAGKVVIAGGGQFPSDTAEAFIYNVNSNTYDYGFANLNISRRNQAGFFTEGDVGKVWVFGGHAGSDNPPYGPPEYLPVKISSALTAAIPTNQNISLNFSIANQRAGGLDWIVTEITTTAILGESTPFTPVNTVGNETNSQISTKSPGTAPLTNVPTSGNIEAVLWDQPLSSFNQLAYADQEFLDAPTSSSFLADDFTNPVPWQITSIFIPGDLWNPPTSLMNATALTWQLYFEASGLPDGDPAGSGNYPIWNLTLPPSDPRVTITNGTSGYPSNTLLTLTSPVLIPPGTYWLVFYPTMNYGAYGQYGRQPSDTTNGSMGKFINPGNGFGYGTGWLDWTVLGPTQTDIAFRLEGSTLADVPWLSENPVKGTIPAGGAQTVAVTFSSVGLTPGVYQAGLVIRRNDPDQSVTLLPVSLRVTNGEVFLPFIKR